MKWRGGRRGGTVEDRRPTAAERRRRNDIKSALGPSEYFQDTARIREEMSRRAGRDRSGMRPGSFYTMGRS